MMPKIFSEAEYYRLTFRLREVEKGLEYRSHDVLCLNKELEEWQSAGKLGRHYKG
jgi:hypothetical protein